MSSDSPADQPMNIKDKMLMLSLGGSSMDRSIDAESHTSEQKDETLSLQNSKEEHSDVNEAKEFSGRQERNDSSSGRKERRKSSGRNEKRESSSGRKERRKSSSRNEKKELSDGNETKEGSTSPHGLEIYSKTFPSENPLNQENSLNQENPLNQEISSKSKSASGSGSKNKLFSEDKSSYEVVDAYPKNEKVFGESGNTETAENYDGMKSGSRDEGSSGSDEKIVDLFWKYSEEDLSKEYQKFINKKKEIQEFNTHEDRIKDFKHRSLRPEDYPDSEKLPFLIMYCRRISGGVIPKDIEATYPDAKESEEVAQDFLEKRQSLRYQSEEERIKEYESVAEDRKSESENKITKEIERLEEKEKIYSERLISEKLNKDRQNFEEFLDTKLYRPYTKPTPTFLQARNIQRHSALTANYDRASVVQMECKKSKKDSINSREKNMKREADLAFTNFSEYEQKAKSLHNEFFNYKKSMLQRELDHATEVYKKQQRVAQLKRDAPMKIKRERVLLENNRAVREKEVPDGFYTPRTRKSLCTYRRQDRFKFDIVTELPKVDTGSLKPLRKQEPPYSPRKIPKIDPTTLVNGLFERSIKPKQ